MKMGSDVGAIVGNFQSSFVVGNCSSISKKCVTASGGLQKEYNELDGCHWKAGRVLLLFGSACAVRKTKGEMTS